MSTTLSYVQKWKEALEVSRKVEQPTQWEFERIEKCVQGLFTFAKFKAGDPVKMAATYPVNQNDSPGWMCYRHLFKAGSKAKIVEVDWYDNKFMYQIQFDKNTYMSTDNKELPCYPDSNPIFSISEKWLKANT